MGVTVDSEGYVYCAGLTASSMSETNGGGVDAFVMKLNPTGELVWLTQLGTETTATGGSNTGNDFCNSVAVDLEGYVYCAGKTDNSMGELNGGFVDAFVMKLNPSGELVWLTQLGSETTGAGDNSSMELCSSVAVDSSGNVYCSGVTLGSMGEANGGLMDAFVMKLNSSGELVWLTQLGADTTAGGSNSSHDQCRGIAVDPVGNVYCAGDTYSSMSESNSYLADAFVMKLNSSGQLLWLTQFGAETVANEGGSNSGTERCNSVAVDSYGNVYCAGSTNGSMSEANGGYDDAFMMKLNSSGELVWHTQFGADTSATGGSNTENDVCKSVAVDSSGNVYCAGYTNSDMGEPNAGDSDAFVVKLSPEGYIQ